MKTIGLIGGLSWESSVEYYRIINQETQKRLGGGGLGAGGLRATLAVVVYRIRLKFN